MNAKEAAAELRALLTEKNDRAFYMRFFALLRVDSKKGGAKVPMLPLHHEQEDMLDCRLAYQENAVDKGRQIGCGLFTQAFDFAYVWREAWRGNSVNTFITAQHKETRNEHIKRVKGLNDSLPAALQLLVVKSTENIVSFEVPGSDGKATSTFLGATANGLSGEGRGFTFQRWHGTETAFYDNLARIYGSITSALHEGPHKSITLESTPNGNLGDWPDLYERHATSAGMHAAFYPWTKNREHRAPLPTDPETYEKSLSAIERAILYDFADQGATLESIEWRRKKLSGLTTERFQQEYPLTVEESFADSATSAPLVHHRAIVKLATGKSAAVKDGWRIFDNYDPRCPCVIGVDVGAGCGANPSVIQVVNAHYEQVAVWSDNTTKPDDLAHVIFGARARFGNARVILECNQIGMMTEIALNRLGIKVYQERTTPTGPLRSFILHAGNRRQIVAHAADLLNRGDVLVRCPRTAAELVSLRDDGSGSYKAPRNGADDHALALIEALWLARTLRQANDPREAALAALNARSAPAKNIVRLWG